MYDKINTKFFKIKDKKVFKYFITFKIANKRDISIKFEF